LAFRIGNGEPSGIDLREPAIGRLIYLRGWRRVVAYRLNEQGLDRR